MAALARLVLGALVLGRAATEPGVVRGGGQRWPVPDGACEAIVPARHPADDPGARKHMFEWYGDQFSSAFDSR